MKWPETVEDVAQTNYRLGDPDLLVCLPTIITILAEEIIKLKHRVEDLESQA